MKLRSFFYSVCPVGCRPWKHCNLITTVGKVWFWTVRVTLIISVSFLELSRSYSTSYIWSLIAETLLQVQSCSTFASLALEFANVSYGICSRRCPLTGSSPAILQTVSSVRVTPGARASRYPAVKTKVGLCKLIYMQLSFGNEDLTSL